MKRREIVFTLRQWEGEYATDVSGSLKTTVRSDVWVVRSDGSGLRRITQLGKGTGNGQWSPDGTWIYFQSNATGDYEIYRCRPDGTEVVNLTSSPGTEDYGFHLSPDGKLIVYSGYEQGQPACTRLMNADGTGQRVAVPATYNYMARFSPDGKSLVYVSLRPNYGVYRCDLEGANELGLVSPRCLVREDGVDCHNPIPSPEGRDLLYFRRVGGVSDLFRVGMEGGNPVQLTHGNTHDSIMLGPKDLHGGSDPPDWSPDGKQIVFATGEPCQIWVMKNDGTKPRQLCSRPTPCGYARWSPEGREVAFVSWVEDRFQLFVVSAKGGSPRQITSLPGAVLWPMWRGS